MFVITGASGRTGRAAASHLLEHGHNVRAVGRDLRNLAHLAAHGAEIYQADQSDPTAMATALRGADAAYLVIQPNYIPDHPDFAAFQDRAAAALTDAVTLSGVPRVVALSSWGAQHPSGTGPVAGLHRFENRLSTVPGVDITWLRAGYYMENLLDHLDSVRTHGRIIAPFDPDVPLPLITTTDVAFAAAEELARPQAGARTRELQGERDVTMNEVARAIATAIDAPVTYERCTVETFHEQLREAGVSDNVAAMMTEVPHAVNTGHLRMTQSRTLETTTPTSLETFVKTEFVPVLNAS
ncbi:NAD-dependent epimerase/dehydratase family protein [Saccharopolyspora terrae]|uniref:NAD-dependent epimerase/dehydratase family protein n=1 Tax=Saccharopolyspora terrae TaxID=2530384 RepID=A0A4R4VEL3_9PSEU|nr:NmrA family NAD(P)-binding protein [Saccharopolyspora terrae]TDD00484.1 NAD-dependent epimerase/dehydratase family protein [Saccharopolyspora terrae]